MQHQEMTQHSKLEQAVSNDFVLPVDKISGLAMAGPAILVPASLL